MTQFHPETRLHHPFPLHMPVNDCAPYTWHQPYQRLSVRFANDCKQLLYRFEQNLNIQKFGQYLNPQI